MRLLRNVLISGLLVLTAGLSAAFAQKPTPRIVHFNVNVPYTFTKTHFTLPAGNYVLRQISLNHRGLFELFQGDMTHAPIAVVRTVPVYQSGAYRNEPTKIYYRLDEANQDGPPIIEGWSMPGDYGFEIISIVPSREPVQARSR